MDKIKRFFECFISVTACNLKCEYCYVIQRDNRKMNMPKLKYSSHTIGEGLTKERLGGTCYFSICGAGETLMPYETIEILFELQKNGHYTNITTNGTLNKRFDEILCFPKEYLQRMHFSFSLHYNELVRVVKLDDFFNNINRLKHAGVSVLVQINLCDEYIPYWDEIKNICIEKVGAPPQVAATRKENNLSSDIELMTDLSHEAYWNKGKEYDSPLFDFTMQNFNVRRKEFCYAGDWSGTLNFGTGKLTRCYGSNLSQDIFADISKPIDFQAVGCHCKALFCMNSSHFMTLGVIPIIDTPSYAKVRNRESVEWYGENVKKFLSGKLVENNKLYSKKQILKSDLYNIKENIMLCYIKIRHFAKKLLRFKW